MAQRVEFQELKSGINSNDVLLKLLEESGVSMRKAGVRYVGCCPFHEERTPSFSVANVNGTWVYKCHGCGQSGDTFTYLMERDGLEFPEAATMLAERLGLEYYISGRGLGSIINRDFIRKGHELLTSVVEKYHQELLKRVDILDYLKARGIGKNEIERFKIGYAPETGFLDGNFDQRECKILAELGIAIDMRDRGIYDLMEKRIIFPLFDMQGRAVSLSGRIDPRFADEEINAQKRPKYMNCRNSALFEKSRIPFGLHHANQSLRIRKEGLHIVEGPPDTVVLDSFGFPTIGIQGVANIGEDMIHTMLRLKYEKEYFIFDSDGAGIENSVKTAGKTLGKLRNPHFVELPTGYDPDDFLLKQGENVFNIFRNDSKQGLEFLVEGFAKLGGIDINSPEGRCRIIELCKPYLVETTKHSEIYLDSFARQLGLATSRIGPIIIGSDEVLPDELKILAFLFSTSSQVRKSMIKELPPETLPTPEGRALARIAYSMSGDENVLAGLEMFGLTDDNLAEKAIANTAFSGELVKPKILRDMSKRILKERNITINGELQRIRTNLYVARLSELAAQSVFFDEKANTNMQKIITEVAKSGERTDRRR